MPRDDEEIYADSLSDIHSDTDECRLVVMKK